MDEVDFELISDQYFDKYQNEITTNAFKTNMIVAQQAFDKHVQETGDQGSNKRGSYRNNRGFFRGYR